MSRTTGAEAAARLWQEHLDAPFPAGLRGVELAGIDMVLLDADIAGCVSTWLNNDGFLEGERHGILRDRIEESERVLPLLKETGHLRYHQRLLQLAHIVKAEV
ncbi:hypothetical protein OHT20_36340 [Streptomyces caniferus]|uniref:Uncharacterized protein n=1 Tax=Streptomyces caniferus TaxID=285557 RepID=A0A640S981_9ACTN|nr:hypothetical protein [Streptomyces caniferus]GFE07799.1 hypothetical protein Scani_40670 [Streptomyces caniferus]